MKQFRSGKFKRHDVSGPLRNICPDEAFHSLAEIDLHAIAEAGKKLILLDVDNTLLPWRSEDIPQETRDWLDSGRAAGLQFCIISNTRNVERLKRLATEMDMKFMNGKFKPSRAMFKQALDEFGFTANEALMVGDQLFTDILGANRTGIETIWVKPLHGREFVGTKVSRMGERFVRNRLYRFLDPYDEIPDAPITPFLKRRVIRQFVKFCIVGAMSTVIDLGLHYVLMFVATWDGQSLSSVVGNWVQHSILGNSNPQADEVQNAAFGVFKIPSVGLAILNSFYWNRKWTFEISDKADQHRQLVKFVVVALIGMCLNVVIATAFHRIIPGHEKRSWALANLIAMVIVVFWNFFAQRLWTFRKALK